MTVIEESFIFLTVQLKQRGHYPWRYPASFYLAVPAMDSIEDALNQLRDMGLAGYRLEGLPFKGFSKIQIGDEIIFTKAQDRVVVNAYPVFLHSSGCEYVGAVPHDTILKPHDLLSEICNDLQGDVVGALASRLESHRPVESLDGKSLFEGDHPEYPHSSEGGPDYGTP